MKMSRLFSQTLRESSAETVSHNLLQRAGFIRPLAAGIFNYLPLAVKSFNKIENILRDEINGIGGQEISMPLTNPADIWKETGRWYQIDREMGRFTDRTDREMALAMTHEECVTDVARNEIRSYRQLPSLVYQIQTKWRDDPRPRAGLIRVREFTMKDSYSFDRDWEGLDKQYQAHYDAYFRIFRRCGLPVKAVGSDSGMMGGKEAHEYMYLTDIGEDTLVFCDSCGYQANRQAAVMKREALPAQDEQELERVHTPACKTIDELSAFLNIKPEETAKAVFMNATIVEEDEEKDYLVLIMIRGDLEVNDTKVANMVKAKNLRPAHEDEIRAAGSVPGYASPVGLDPNKLIILSDDSLQEDRNYVAGSNEAEYHMKGIRPGRDFKCNESGDLAAAGDGHTCAECGGKLYTSRGVEVGNIFKLGTRYSEAMGCVYQDKDGKEKPVIMGSYGIGVGRLLACVAEESNDEGGLIWPISIAPFEIALIDLCRKSDKASEVYEDLKKQGFDIIIDDRDERPGVKFNDADLIGFPIRVTIGDKSLKEGVAEVKLRHEKDFRKVPLQELTATLSQLRQDLFASLNG